MTPIELSDGVSDSTPFSCFLHRLIRSKVKIAYHGLQFLEDGSVPEAKLTSGAP